MCVNACVRACVRACVCLRERERERERESSFMNTLGMLCIHVNTLQYRIMKVFFKLKLTMRMTKRNRNHIMRRASIKLPFTMVVH